MENKKKINVLIVGHFATGSLEYSMLDGLTLNGYATHPFDIHARIEHHCRLGRLGRTINTFLPVGPWVAKANREMILRAKELQPDLVMVVGNNWVQAGGLAQVRATTNAQLVMVWPDTLLNLRDDIIAALPLYDLVASYSQAAIEQFKNLGAKHVEWIPLGADPELHKRVSVDDERVQRFRCDVSFVGDWRPEREEVLLAVGSLPGIDLKIWGGRTWRPRARENPVIGRCWQKAPMFGSNFAAVVAASRINMNIIDHTNYPAANMRFFEIPAAGGLELCSMCPEQSHIFRNGEDLFYFDNLNQLAEIIPQLLSDSSLRARVAASGHEKVLAKHTYAHRTHAILDALEM